MSIAIGTKPPKQKSKTHLQKKPYITKKKNLYKALLNSTMNNDLCISQTYSNDNVKTSRLKDTHIVMNKSEYICIFISSFTFYNYKSLKQVQI
jgi:hypothetical protein